MKNILICPLDWGLGHATRCMPIIDALKKQGCQVFVASSGAALELLKKEYPEMLCFRIEGYRPAYKGRWLGFSILLQVPRFLRTIRKEHAAVKNIISENKIDIIISDNRYGCRSVDIVSIFITHQISIKAGLFSEVVNRVNRWYIRKFSACWIPDIPGLGSLAGELSESENLNTIFIGHLSRFHLMASPLAMRYDVVAIVSGPEPQRGMFENKMRDQLRKTKLKYLLIKGRPEEPDDVLLDSTQEIDHLSTPVMSRVLQEAKMIISRSGYSTIMDMARLGKKVIFVPTPGQTEQEYLATRLMKNGIAFMMEQRSFSLDSAMTRSASYAGFSPSSQNDLLQKAIVTLLT